MQVLFLIFLTYLFPTLTAVNQTADRDPAVRKAGFATLDRYGNLAYPALWLYSQDERPAIKQARLQVESDLEYKRLLSRRKTAGPAPEEWMSPANWGQPQDDDQDNDPNTN